LDPSMRNGNHLMGGGVRDGACASIPLLAFSEEALDYTQQLLCAQMLLQRLTRAKLHESIDWEAEQAEDWTEGQALEHFLGPLGAEVRPDGSAPLPLPFLHPNRLEASYRAWTRSVHPWIGTVLDHYVTTAKRFSSLPSSSHEEIEGASSFADEDRAKGEMTLATLASIAFLAALSAIHSQHPSPTSEFQPPAIVAASLPSVSPLLSTLGSSMALVALRLMQGAPTGSTTDPSLGQRITYAFGAVWNAAVSVPERGSENHHPLSCMADIVADEALAKAMMARALTRSVHACLSALPDAILGSPGGARIRISVDPRCLQAAATELRITGWVHMWEAVQQLKHLQPHSDGAICTTDNAALTLDTVHAWSKYLPLPLELVQPVSSVINSFLAAPASQWCGDETAEASHSPCIVDDVELHGRRKAALACLAAVLEGGAWDLEQVLAQRVGLNEHQQQATNKRQSSRSKKRQRELVESNATDEIQAEAQSEVENRGKAAWWLAFSVWDSLRTFAAHDLAQFGGSAGRPLHHCGVSFAEVHGEGPIGCVAAAANVCLPFMVRNAPEILCSQSPYEPNVLTLFPALAGLFQKICASPSKSVRTLALEPLYSLRGAIDADHSLDEPLESLLVDHLFAVRERVYLTSEEALDSCVEFVILSSPGAFRLQCCMGLAGGCGYPADYFDDVSLQNDEDLETERNDVRDLLRALVSPPVSISVKTPLNLIPLKLLLRLLFACDQSLRASVDSRVLLDEVFLHAFSSLGTLYALEV
jgi:hypothetical protein